MEFLLQIEVRLPADMPEEAREELVVAEHERGRQLCEDGVIRAVWRIPGRFANCAIWSARDATHLHQAVSSLPLWRYLDVTVTPLARHELGPTCPGLPGGLAIDSST
jgi:muconolactone delta-isomerase